MFLNSHVSKCYRRHQIFSPVTNSSRFKEQAGISSEWASHTGHQIRQYFFYPQIFIFCLSLDGYSVNRQRIVIWKTPEFLPKKKWTSGGYKVLCPKQIFCWACKYSNHKVILPLLIWEVNLVDQCGYRSYHDWPIYLTVLNSRPG